MKWTRRWTGEYILTGIAWSGSQFVVVAPFGVMTSPDGLTWKAMGWRQVPVVGEAGARPWNYGAHGVMWGGSQFVAVGFTQQTQLAERRALIVTSPDGLTWTRRSTPASVGLVRDVAWSGDKFVAVGEGPGDRFVAVGKDTTGPKFLTSPDGVTWSAQTIPADGYLSAVTWGGSQFVAVGTQGQPRRPLPLIVTSPDGVMWTERSPPASAESLEGVAWSGERFVAVGTGTILTSPDGVTWSAQSSPTHSLLSAVTWSGSQFVAVGPVIMTSPDGMIWTIRRGGDNFFDAAWSGTRFVAIGFRHRGSFATTTEGLIVTSP